MPVNGQLWYLTQGVGEDTRLVFINSDGTNHVVEIDNDPDGDLGTNFPEDVVVDTAAGRYFVLVGDGSGTNASILSGLIGSGLPPTAVQTYDPFGALVYAMHLDAANNKLYVSFVDFNDFGDATQGIKVYDYDPGSGALSNEQFLFTQTTADVDASVGDAFLELFVPRDFDFDFERGYVYFAQHTLGDGFESNMVWRLDLNDPSAPAVPLAPQAQFPLDGDGADFTTLNGIIIDVEIDGDSDRVYFSTHAEDTGDAPGEDAIWMVANASTADGTLPAVQVTLVGVNLADFYPGDIALDAANNILYVESEHVNNGTGPDDDVILVFQLDALGTTATLIDTIAPGFADIANIAGMQFNPLPVLDDLDGNPTPATEQGAAVDLLTGAPTITDVDGGHLASANVQITGGTFAGSDTVDNLGVGAGFQQSGLVAGTNITIAWNQATSTLTLSGYDTLDNYEAVLAMVRYQATGDDPTNGGANPSRTVTWTVSDGALGIPGGQQNSGTTTLAITAVNDAPVNTTGGPIALLETDPPVAVTGLAVSDVDADPATDAIEVTLSVSLGTITVSTAVPGGITAGNVTGNGTNTVIITATQNAINATFAAANGVTYAPGASGVDTLTMTTNDLGNTGAGGAQQDTDLVAITVINVNDAPSAPTNNSVSTAEDTASGATAIGATDPDNDSLTYSEKPGFGAANGTVTFDNMNGTFTYTPDPDYFGSDSFTILIDDGNGGTAEQVVSVTVTPVNDAPTAPAAGSASATEDSASAATAIGASDVDGDTLTYSEKAGAEASNGSVTFDQFNGTFTYAPDPNFNGSDSFTILIADGNGGTAEQVVTVTVAAVNDAPTVAGDGTEQAATIDEDTPSAAGQTVASLFGGQYSDATDQVAGGSSADAFAGIAITVNGSNPGQGQWQYFNGANWVNIGAASTGAAVLIAAGTSIRFNPALDFVGAAPTLTAHLVDASAGAIVSGALANLGATGGTTRYSDGTVVLSQEVQNVNDAPTGVTGTLTVHEFPGNGTAVGTLVGQDPDSNSFTYQLLNNAGGRFAMDSAGNVTVADGLLIDFEQQNVHAITVRVTDDQGASSDFVVNVSITDVLGENVTGDGRGNYMVGGAENDIFYGVGGNDLLLGGGGSDTLNGGLGNDSLLGGAGSGDILLGGDGSDWLDGGAGADTMTGGAGNDVFVFTKGEANGDVITDFFGRGNAQGDQIVLAGYAAGTTFTRVGNGSSNLYKIDDHGFIEFVTIYATGQVHGSDYDVVTNYDYDFWW